MTGQTGRRRVHGRRGARRCVVLGSVIKKNIEQSVTDRTKSPGFEICAQYVFVQSSQEAAVSTRMHSTSARVLSGRLGDNL